MKALEMKLPKIAVFPLNDQYNHLIKRNNASNVSVFPLKIDTILVIDVNCEGANEYAAERGIYKRRPDQQKYQGHPTRI